MRRPHTIVLATDDSETAEWARPVAESLSERFRAELHELRVESLAEATSLAVSTLEKPSLPNAVRAVRLAEIPGRGILNYAMEVGADLIVMGTHGRHGADRLIHGSSSEYVLRRATCPVLLVPSTAPSRGLIGGRIVVAHDFSSPAAMALVAGRMMARALGMPLDVLHAVEVTYVPSPFGPVAAPTDYEALRERSIRLLTAVTAGEPYARPVATIGNPISELVDYARGKSAGLIVLGSHGRRGVSRLLLGSVAEGVARRAPCPVLITPSPTPSRSFETASIHAFAAA